jgi:hypothetical protein
MFFGAFFMVCSAGNEKVKKENIDKIPVIGQIIGKFFTSFMSSAITTNL